MSYRFVADLAEADYRLFAKEYIIAPFSQMPAWAHVKNNWKSTLCGLYDDDKLVAASLLLCRSLPFGQRLLYAPRGFLIDYQNREAVAAFIEGVRQYAKTQHAFCVKFDPFVRMGEHEGVSGEEVIDALTAAGCFHKGFHKALDAYNQPRFQMAVRLTDENGPLGGDRLKSSFRKGAKIYIGNYAQKRGVYYKTDTESEDLAAFKRLLSCTEKRQGIALRDEAYYRRMRQAFGADMAVFYAGVHLDEYIAFCENAMAKGQDVEKNAQNLSQARQLKAERGGDVLLAAGLVLLPPPCKGIKVAEYLYAGTDLTVLPQLNAANGMLHKAMCYCMERGCDYFNLGGVDGDLQSPLAEFKQKFNPELFEFVGEFDIVVGRLRYTAFEKLLPTAKKMLRKIRRGG